MRIDFLKKIIFTMLVAIIICPVSQTLAKEKSFSKFSSTYEKRDRAMDSLLKKNQDIVKNIQGLSEKEKNSIIALIAVTKAMTRYEAFAVKKNEKLIGAFYKQLGSLSQASSAPGKFQILLNACFDQTVSCLRAKQECLGLHEEEGETFGAENTCDSDPKVYEPCANEAICVTEKFMDFEHRVPGIIDGRDPFPPMPPFPYY